MAADERLVREGKVPIGDLVSSRGSPDSAAHDVGKVRSDRGRRTPLRVQLFAVTDIRRCPTFGLVLVMLRGVGQMQHRLVVGARIGRVRRASPPLR